MLSQIPLREVCQALSKLTDPSTADTPMIFEFEVSSERSSLEEASSSSAFGFATESELSGSCREEATSSSLRKEARSRLSSDGCSCLTEAAFTSCKTSRRRTEARHWMGNLMSSRSEPCDWIQHHEDREGSSLGGLLLVEGANTSPAAPGLDQSRIITTQQLGRACGLCRSILCVQCQA